jgi:hypothetical protein
VFAPDNDDSISEQKHVHIQEHGGVYREWKRAKVLRSETVHVYLGVVE